MKASYISSLPIVAILISSCSIGGNISELPVAQQAEGESIRVVLKDNWFIEGELLSVDENSITMLADSVNRNVSNQKNNPKPLPTVTSIAFDKIGLVHLIDINHTIFRDGDFYKYKNIELRYLSRYPQHIDSSIMKRLLTTYQQDSLWVI